MFIAQCVQDFSATYGLPTSLFIAGLIGGFTHCAGMCSPFILAQTKQGPEPQKLRSALLLPYHLGRMTTYIILGILVNAIINPAFIFSETRVLIAAPILTLAGLMFLVSAFPNLSAIFPWIATIKVAPPYKIITRFSSGLINNPNAVKRYALGILLGFIPCGLVTAALLATATAPHIGSAAIAMAAFTAGTIPALVITALGGRAILYKYPRATKRLSQGAMAISGIWLFILAGMMIL